MSPNRSWKREGAEKARAALARAEADPMMVSCAHCSAGDATCCQCSGTRRVPFEKARESVTWAWHFGGCRCDACNRLRAKYEHITRQPAPAPGHVAAPAPAMAPTAEQRHAAHAKTFGNSFLWCQHTDCVRARADRRIA